MLELRQKIASQAQTEMSKEQREYLLRQQLRAIQQELGEQNAEQAEVALLRQRLAEAAVPDDVRKEFEEREGVVVGVRSEAPDEEETVAPAVAVAEVAVPVEPPVTRVVQEEEEPRSAMAEAFRVSGMTDASEDVAEEEQTSAEVHAVADDATSVTPPTDTVSDEPAAADEEAVRRFRNHFELDAGRPRPLQSRPDLPSRVEVPASR